MDMSTSEKHIKLNPSTKSQNTQLYKKMYIFPENQIGQIGGKNNTDTILTSFRNVSEYPIPVDLEKKNNPDDFKKEKKPCHVCKKKSLKKEKKINLSRKTLEKPKLKKKKKKSAEYAKIGKTSLLNKQNLLSKMPKDKNDKNLKSVTLHNNSKPVSSLDPSILKFNSQNDFRIFFNKIYQNALNKNTSSNERLNSYLQLVELYKSLDKYEDSREKQHLSELFAEKLQKAGNLVLDPNAASANLSSSILSESNLPNAWWWDPVVNTPKEARHENIMSALYDGFVETVSQHSPYIQYALENYRTPLKKTTASTSTPLKLKSTHSQSKQKLESSSDKLKTLKLEENPAHLSKITGKSKSPTKSYSPRKRTPLKETGAIPKRSALQRSPVAKSIALRQQELAASKANNEASLKDQNEQQRGRKTRKDWVPELLERRSPVQTRSSKKKKN